MKTPTAFRIQSRGKRRGVTLVEMLVTLAMLLLIMTAIVRVFQVATGALNSAQVYLELDNGLRLLDSTIRSDLNGVTCKMTPPNNPKDNTGYFEYGENAFADLQLEDSDDYIRFTAKAPAGRPFTGRVWVAPSPINQNVAVQPITITSDYAEIIYFLRNGNLYRRVLLVAPDRQSSIVQAVNNVNPVSLTGFNPAALGGNPLNPPPGLGIVSWQGVNDLSARPAGTGTGGIVLNTLGDLTNRENRFAYQRFANDYIANATGAAGPDGIPDDANADGIPDFYPTVYFGNPWVQVPPYVWPANGNPSTMAFPFVFPGAYTTSETQGQGLGRIHSPTPAVNIGSPAAPVAATYETNTLPYLYGLNHNPLDIGDNLPVPPNVLPYIQTWWGFPTWRETLSPYWVDPTLQLYVNAAQPPQLSPIPPDVIFPDIQNFYGTQLLPPMTPLCGVPAGPCRVVPQLYTDGAGASSAVVLGGGVTILPFWPLGWEDDLIMTGVRSFDVKAYDNALADYADLGYGDDARAFNQVFIADPQNIYTVPGSATPFLFGNADYLTQANGYEYPPMVPIKGVGFDYINQTFAHEGRMPPLLSDNRLDAQFPNTTYQVPTDGGLGAPNYALQYPGYNGYSSNVGHNTTTIVRLRRVWDSWSTDYTNAPANAINNAPAPGNSLPAGLPSGPPFQPPIYPSYPPPYPAPLRGIQIQIRVTDPSNQRIKTLTIHQDFSDKL